MTKPVRMKMSSTHVKTYMGTMRVPCEGWFYEALGSIELYTRDPNESPPRTRVTRITKKVLKDWIRRSDAIQRRRAPLKESKP